MGEIQENTPQGIIVEKEDGKVNIIIDMSKFDLFELCHYRYNARYNLKRSLPVHAKSRSLDYGTIAHTGFEVYYKQLAEGIHYNDRMNATLMKMREFSSNPDLSAADPDEVNVVLRAVEESCDYWRADDENTLEILAVETPFAYTLFEDDVVRIIISGKIDLLVNEHGIGRNASYQNLPYDHKTMSRDFEAPRLSNQFMNYAKATGSNFLRVNKVGLQKTLKAEAKYKRVMYSYDPLILDDWAQNVTKVILNEFLPCIGREEWTMNFTSCLKFNRLCEYYEVCDSSGNEAKLFKLNNNYIEAEEWDVTKGLVNE